MIPSDHEGLHAGSGHCPAPTRVFFSSKLRRTPMHPGSFLDSRFLRPLRLTQEQLATALGVSRRRINELIVGKRAITPDTALRLGLYFQTGPEFWLKLQLDWDTHVAWQGWRSHQALQTKLPVLPRQR